MALQNPLSVFSTKSSQKPFFNIIYSKKLAMLFATRSKRIVEIVTLWDQVDSRRIRSTGDQILSLSTHIGTAGFQERLKTRTILADLTAGNDNILSTRVPCKFMKIIRSRPLRQLTHAQKSLHCCLAWNQSSRNWRLLKNGLPQGSVLSLALSHRFTDNWPKL